MIKKLLTTFAVLTVMTAFAMAQTEPILNSGTITNKGTITVGCTVAGSSVLNDAGTINNNSGGSIEFTGAGAVLTNDNAGTITNDGTILFETANPMFANTAGTVTNTGTIQFDGTINTAVMSGLGTAAADRLGGTVVYNAGSGNQIVQGGFWYTNLTLSAAGTKTFSGGEHYYVYDDYTVTGSGDRTYAGSIFHYDGDEAQTITPEGDAFIGGVNFYYNLQLEGDGTKTIAASTTVRVANIFNEIVTPETPDNSLEMGAGSLLSFAPDINADVAGPILVDGGQIIMEGDGAFDVAGSSSMTFQGTNPLFEMNGGNVTNAGLMEFKSGSYDQKSGNSLHAGQLTLSGGDYNQITGNVLIQGAATISDATSTYKQDAGQVMITGGMTVLAGLFDINGTDATDDLVTIAADGGSLSLSSVDGLIDMAAGTNMLVNGSFTNAAATPTNLTFASTSTVTYDGGTQILVTDATNSFGNLVLKTSAKTPLADIYVGGNFSLSDADLNMNTSIATNSTLYIKTASATNVVYGTGLITDMEQVIGKMNRTIGDAAENVALVYNNNATVITMTTLGLDDLTLNVTPGDNTYGDYKDAEDIMRSIAFDYEEGTAGWQVTMAYGYKFDELPGSPDANFKESLLRFREVLTSTSSEKVATGSDPLRKATVGAPEEWGRVTLAGINSPTLALATVADNAELFLRGTPTTFYTISDGRWSNPGTWDEGTQPTYLDRTEILHTVHVGFEGGFDFGVADGQIDERAQSGFSGLAQEILITNEEGASLIFGNHEGGLYNSSSQIWAMNTGGIITNQNATAPTQAADLVNLDGNDLQAFVDSGTAKYQGLIIFGDTNPLSLQTNQLVNATGGNVMVGPNTTLQICDTP